MDGQLFESDLGIDVALTIGTKYFNLFTLFDTKFELCARIPSIDILRVYSDGSQLIFQKLASIPSASFTRFLKGSLVGFAVRDDDDAFPHVVDWKTGHTWVLKAEGDELSSVQLAASIDERVSIQNLLEFDCHTFFRARVTL